ASRVHRRDGRTDVVKTLRPGACRGGLAWGCDLCGRAGHDRVWSPVVPALQTGQEVLAAHRVRYAFVDIDTDPQAIARLKELQNGGQIIPTVVYRDGTHEVNPSDE